MSAVPKFSTIQQVLKRAFFPKEQTITIYTEDKPSDRYLYSIILNRLLLNDIKINSIIPLGPKSKVIEASIRSRGSSNNSLFIVDSDIGLMQEQPIEDVNIIGLKKYCIENYLCCEDGIVDYLYPKIGKDKKEIRRDIKFRKEVKSNLCPIVKLYYRYFLSFRLGCGCTFRKYDYFLKGIEPNRTVDRTILNQEISAVETEIKSKLKKNGIRTFAKEMKEKLKEIEVNNPTNEETALKILSGKAQLFPLVRELLIRFDSTTRYLSNDQLKRLLGEKFDIRELSFLKDKIVEIAN